MSIFATYNSKIMKYKRILLKLSGEALMGERQYGIDPKILVSAFVAEPTSVLNRLDKKSLSIKFFGTNRFGSALIPFNSAFT